MSFRRWVASSIVALAVVVVPAAAEAVDGTVVVGNATQFGNAFVDGDVDGIVMTASFTLNSTLTRPMNADPLVIDGQGNTLTAAPNTRMFETVNPVGDLTLNNITITGTNPAIGQGGVMQWLGGDVIVNNAQFLNNNAVSQGVDILVNGTDVIVNDSVFDGTNTGAIFGAGTVTVTNSFFTRNLGTGAIAGGDVHVTNSTFVGNESVLGGAIRAINLTLIDSTVTGNSAFTSGGGVQAGGSVTILNSTITGNEAGDFGNGGGVYNLGTETLIVNSTITGNHADGQGGQGGGVFSSGEVTVVYSDIVGNSAPTAANIGGFEEESSLASYATVVANPLGGGDNCENIPATSDGYNYEQGGSTCGFGAAPGDVTNGSDPQLGALAANGGPTETLLPATTSPLVDAIPVAACSAGPATGISTDQRGVVRPQGDGCDIGSVELTEEVPADQVVEVIPRLTG
jgi:hypothetical protein